MWIFVAIAVPVTAIGLLAGALVLVPLMSRVREQLRIDDERRAAELRIQQITSAAMLDLVRTAREACKA